jgi:predicted amidohydrolase YtcJ
MNALRDAGVTVSLATDNAPISLWGPVQQTIVRRDFKSQRVVGPNQALSRIEALRCATANGAYLTFDEDKKGTVEPGKFADLAVLTADPLAVEEIKNRGDCVPNNNGRREDCARGSKLVTMK